MQENSGGAQPINLSAEDQEVDRLASSTAQEVLGLVDVPLADKGVNKAALQHMARELAERAANSLGWPEDKVRHAGLRAEEIVHHRLIGARLYSRDTVTTLPPGVVAASPTDTAVLAGVVPSATPEAAQRREQRRVNVNFSAQAYATLEQMARQTGKSMSEVLRDAIALKAWFEQTRAEGGHVLVERPDGKVREVISV